jgi:hypothetical protein
MRWLLAFVAVLWTLPALANDSSIESVGGVWKQTKGESQVELTREKVSLTLDDKSASVKVEAVYTNRGKACTVNMGFPESGWNEPDKGAFAKTFRTWVDGEKVDARPSQWEKAPGTAHRSRWWTKAVAFAVGQVRTVRVEYSSPLGNQATGDHFAEYVLSTGANWLGPIGTLDVEILAPGRDLRDLDTRRLLAQGYSPSRFALKGDRLLWHIEGLEPTDDDNIKVIIPTVGDTPCAKAPGGRCVPRADSCPPHSARNPHFPCPAEQVCCSTE